MVSSLPIEHTQDERTISTVVMMVEGVGSLWGMRGFFWGYNFADKHKRLASQFSECDTNSLVCLYMGPIEGLMYSLRKAVHHYGNRLVVYICYCYIT